jgi:hypothetical protein
MVLYNVTVGIDTTLEEEWLEWMKEKHIPDVMKTGQFDHFKIFKVLNQEQEDTVSYSVQYFANNIDDVVTYLNDFAPALSEEHRVKFKDRHVAFRTLLEEVS